MNKLAVLAVAIAVAIGISAVVRLMHEPFTPRHDGVATPGDVKPTMDGELVVSGVKSAIPVITDNLGNAYKFDSCNENGSSAVSAFTSIAPKSSHSLIITATLPDIGLFPAVAISASHRVSGEWKPIASASNASDGSTVTVPAIDIDGAEVLVVEVAQFGKCGRRP